ncbi:MAG: hypothetical protein WBW71_11790 [Bacteroidota bacterium]
MLRAVAPNGLTIKLGMSYMIYADTNKTYPLTMEEQRTYIEHPGKAVVSDKRFKHVMALTLDPRSGNKDGILRCIISREGDVEFSGSIDRSVLHKVRGDSLVHFSIEEALAIENESETVRQLRGDDWDFLGLEDPDIWRDEKTDLMHVYFTIPFRNKTDGLTLTHLGHAVGSDFNSIKMTPPVLMDRAKEVCIAPPNKQGIRYNLVESSEFGKDFWYSTVRVAVAEDMGKSWEYGETVFHPEKQNIPWIGGHASPGPLLPETFVNIGPGKRVGILNGRERNQIVGNKIKFGIFSVGLFIYDYEKGKIDWFSTEPFIRDSQAKTSTFASQFVEIDRTTGIIYAQVDNSFVRAFTLNANRIKSLVGI